MSNKNVLEFKSKHERMLNSFGVAGGLPAVRSLDDEDLNRLMYFGLLPITKSEDAAEAKTAEELMVMIRYWNPYWKKVNLCPEAKRRGFYRGKVKYVVKAKVSDALIDHVEKIKDFHLYDDGDLLGVWKGYTVYVIYKKDENDYVNYDSFIVLLVGKNNEIYKIKNPEKVRYILNATVGYNYRKNFGMKIDRDGVATPVNRIRKISAYDISKIEDAVMRKCYSHSSDNRGEIERSERCFCAYCGAVFSPKEIMDYVWSGSTALCPNCEIDSVLAEECGYPITEEFFYKLRRWVFRECDRAYWGEQPLPENGYK